MKELKEQYQKYKAYLWPVISVVASIVIVVFVIFPQAMDFFTTQDKLTSLQNRLIFLETKAQELEGINQTEVKKDLQTTYSILPSDQDVPQAMTVMQDFVNKAGLTLKNTNYLASQRPGESSFLLSVTVAGQIQSIRNFFILLQEAPRIFRIEAIDARFQQNESLVEAEIPISVLFSQNTQVSGSSDQPLPKLSEDDIKLISQLQKNLSTLNIGSAQATESSIPLGKQDPFK